MSTGMLGLTLADATVHSLSVQAPAEDTVAPLLAFVVDRLAAVPGVLRVLSYHPIATPGAQIPATMGPSGQVHFWSVVREATPEQYIGNLETHRQHHVLIRGYLEVNDPSMTSPQFQGLIERIMATFRGVYQVEAAGEGAEIIGPMQLSTVGHRILGATILTHYCECRTLANERTSP